MYPDLDASAVGAVASDIHPVCYRAGTLTFLAKARAGRHVQRLFVAATVETRLHKGLSIFATIFEELGRQRVSPCRLCVDKHKSANLVHFGGEREDCIGKARLGEHSFSSIASRTNEGWDIKSDSRRLPLRFNCGHKNSPLASPAVDQSALGSGHRSSTRRV